MKTSVKILLFVVTFIAFGAILAALYLYNMKHKDMSAATPDFIITASALEKEFEDDETAASAKYINKIVEVSGTIVSVNPTENDVLSISLATDNPISSVICTFQSIKNKSELTAGSEITLRGECSGFLMDVLLNNCSLIKTN